MGTLWLDDPLVQPAAVRRESACCDGCATEELVDVVQQLSLARDLATVMNIVRNAGRALTGADGATFVLREGGDCFYAEENAIAPLWKGRRFPMQACISGWVMLHRESATIEDIYSDPRIPAEAYRPTFVRSLVMVPIRTREPLGAIGNYWATLTRPTPRQVRVLQALADATAVAMENLRVYAELEQRVQERTAALEQANRELRWQVAERERAEAEVRRLSLTDDLTGLNNRRGFFLLAEQHFKAARRSNSRCSLLFCDVDDLKRVNDSHGHEAGDRLILSAAAALRANARESDIVGRLGGDEFVVFMVGVDESPTEIGCRLQEEIERSNRRNGDHFNLSLSVGIVSCDPHSTRSLNDLLELADTAMYEEKRRKKALAECGENTHQIAS